MCSWKSKQCTPLSCEDLSKKACEKVESKRGENGFECAWNGAACVESLTSAPTTPPTEKTCDSITSKKKCKGECAWDNDNKVCADAKDTDAPTTGLTSAPTTGPMTSAPTAGPMTSAPTTAGPTAAPTQTPTTPPTEKTCDSITAKKKCKGECAWDTDKSVCADAKDTDAPTAAPTTAAPTTAAPTDAPTAAPTTAAPTDAPTDASTDAPTIGGLKCSSNGNCWKPDFANAPGCCADYGVTTPDKKMLGH